MEIEVFDSTSIVRPTKGALTCRINHKSGTISFSRMACEKMSLGVGTAVSFGYDQKQRTWFVYQHANGFKLRGKTEHGRTFNNSFLARKIIGDEVKSKLFKIGQPTEENSIIYYPLLG